MRKAEREFRPSDYDSEPGATLHPETAAGGDTLVMDLPEMPAVPPELVAGFRVQIFSTTDIDEATAIKDTAEAHFPAEWFYLVYEPPTYKVRAGDLLTRHEADRLAKLLREGGYDDSWVVPDRVYRTPPLKRAPTDG